MTEYVFKLTVTDNNGATHFQTVTVEIVPPAVPWSVYNGTEWVEASGPSFYVKTQSSTFPMTLPFTLA